MRKRVLAAILAVCLVAQGAGASAEEATVSGNDIPQGETQTEEMTEETGEETPEETERETSGDVTVSGNEPLPESTEESGEAETETETAGYTESETETGTETETETQTETEEFMLLEAGAANITGFTACSPQELADGLNRNSAGVNCALLSGSTVTLLADIVMNDYGYINYQAGLATGLEFDLNGHMITADNNQVGIIISNLTNAADNIVIRDGSIVNPGGVGIWSVAGATRVTLSGLQIQGGSYGLIIENGELTFEGGVCQGGGTGIKRVVDSKLTINGGTIKGIKDYGLEVTSTYDGVELNGGVYSGGVSSYKGDWHKLSELAGTGKTAYHYDAGGRGTKFTSAEFARKEIDGAFEIADGETGLIDINGSINVTGHDESTSKISLNSTTEAGIGFIGTIRADGTYFLAGVPDGKYSIGLTINGASALEGLKRYGFDVSDGAVAPSGAEHIVLGNARLSGTVDYDDGVSAGAVTVRLVNSQNPGIWYENGGVYTGEYRVPYVPAGQYAAELTLPGGERAIGMMELKDGENTWNVAFPRGVTGGVMVTGKVQDASGNPVSGAGVSIIESAGGGHSWSVVTDAGGHFQIAGLPDGSYVMKAQKEGFSGEGVAGFTLSGGKLAAGTTNMMIGRGIYGHVATEDGAPYTGAEVILKSHSTGGQYSATVQADGKFVLEAAVMGMYDVIIKKGGMEVYINNLLINDDAVTRDWTIGSATLEGAVRDADGRPLSGISVSAAGGKHGYMMSGAVTGADGSYKISGLPAGHYTVYAQPSAGPGVSREIDIGKGENVLCGLIIGSGSVTAGTVSGTVTDGGGTALAGITVSYKNKAGGAVLQAVTDAVGKYKIDVLPDGEYDVLLIGAGLNMVAGQVIMNGGAPSGNTSFVTGTGGLKGFVKSSDGGAVQGAWVSVKNKATGNVYNTAAVSGADGSYEIMGVPSGEYMVTVKASGKKDAVEDIIISSSVLNKNFNMLPAENSGGGNSGGGGSGSGGGGGNSGGGSGNSGGGSGSGGGGDNSGGGSGSGEGGDNSGGGSGSGGGGDSFGGSGQASGGGADTGMVPGIPGETPGIPGSVTAITGGGMMEGIVGENAGIPGTENPAGQNGNLPDAGQQTVPGSASQTDSARPDAAGAVARPNVKPIIEKSPAGTIKGGLNGGNFVEADVTITDKQSGKIFREKTDKKGGYYFKDIPDGSYSIRITTKDGTVMTADFSLQDGMHTLSASSFRIFAAGQKEPKTGDPVPTAVSVALIGGLAYLMEFFCDKKDIRLGITKAQKDWLVDKIVAFARKRNKFVRYLAVGIIFMLLVFYYSLGKIVDTDMGEVLYA